MSIARLGLLLLLLGLSGVSRLAYEHDGQTFVRAIDAKPVASAQR